MIEENDDENFLFIRIGKLTCIMCGKKHLNPFFRLHEASMVLNKYAKGMWSDNFTAGFSLMSLCLLLLLISRELKISNMFMNWNNLFSESNEHV